MPCPPIYQVADFLLAHYYDSMYAYQAKKRGEEMGGAVFETVACPSGDALGNAKLLVEAARHGGRVA